jgi:hypothetical protein
MMMTQAAGSLTTYGLLVWDSQLEIPSENMDDYLFYTKALTKGLEFILATAIVVGGNEQMSRLGCRWAVLWSRNLRNCNFLTSETGTGTVTVKGKKSEPELDIKLCI